MPDLSHERIFLNTPHADPEGYPVDPEIVAMESELKATLQNAGVDPESEEGRAFLKFYVGGAIDDQYYDILDSTM